jgi:long-chain fatty acid transport protein
MFKAKAASDIILPISVLLCLATGNSMAAGFYITEIGTPGSLGTAGAANPTNTYHADSAWTNPAGMTGLDEDRIVAGLQVVAPRVEFDPSVAEAGGKDGGNAGKAVPIPSLFYVKTLSDRGRFGFSVIAPQGGGVNYGDDFVGRYSSTKAEIGVIGLSPCMSVKARFCCFLTFTGTRGMSLYGLTPTRQYQWVWDNEDKYLAMVENSQTWCHASGPGGVPNGVFRGEPFWCYVRPNVFM